MFGSWGVGGVGDWVGVSVWVGGGRRFYKRNPLNQNLKKSQNVAQKSEGVNFTKEIKPNEISENLKILQINHLRRIRYFCIQNSKIQIPVWILIFLSATLQLVPNIKPI